MTLHFADDQLTVHIGDCREVLATLPAESVHCVVTSPPYWGLRDYGTATWEGGEDGCDHLGPPRMSDKTGLSHPELKPREQILAEPSRLVPQPYRETCGKCGARRIDCQLGLEATPEEYVANMVAVFREVRRVLRSDGTVWLNIGDSYASGDFTRQGKPRNVPQLPNDWEGTELGDRGRAGHAIAIKRDLGRLKPKDLVGIPWRLAFALQADGWYLRSDIIWSKPNPMPESVTDRPTKAHEYLFLLSKSARYYYDAEAVREASIGATEHDLTGQGYRAPGQTPQTGNRQRVPAGWDTAEGGHVTTRNNGRMPGPIQYREVAAGRNLRTVWSIATQPYPGAHFATFPEKLVEPCIKAGTSERGVCPECGAPWVRIAVPDGDYAGRAEAQPFRRTLPPEAFAAYIRERRLALGLSAKDIDDRLGTKTAYSWWEGRASGVHLPEPAQYRALKVVLGLDDRYDDAFAVIAKTRPGWQNLASDPLAEGNRKGGAQTTKTTTTTGWRPSCAHDAEPVPATVLDPFGGSGTTARVANRLGRRAILIDLSADYIDQAMERNAQAPLGLLG